MTQLCYCKWNSQGSCDLCLEHPACTHQYLQHETYTQQYTRHLSCLLSLCILYSGKFSWVQIYVEMPPDPPEEIFVVFIFMECAHSSDHTPTLIHMYTTSQYTMNVAWLKFLWSYFRCYLSIRKNCTP